MSSSRFSSINSSGGRRDDPLLMPITSAAAATGVPGVAYADDQAAFHRRLLEGVDEEEIVWNRNGDDDNALMAHARRIGADSDAGRFTLSKANGALVDPYYNDDGSSRLSRLFTPRCRTVCTFIVGFSMILFVLILFVVLLNKDMHHRASPERLRKHVFRMQLLGQSVLHDDVEEGDRTGLAGKWQSNWTKQLYGDFVLTDLETSVTGPWGGIDWRNSIYSHIASPDTIDVLLGMGFNTFTCANNHAFDLEAPGIFNMLDAIANRNTSCAGIGLNLPQAQQAQLFPDRNGKGITLALVGVASGSISKPDATANATRAGINGLRVTDDGVVDPNDLAAQLATISGAAAVPGIDLVAVVHHNHYQANTSEDSHNVDPWRIDLAHQMIDAGASLYLSHGVPTPQGIEIYNGYPILYGLGNFIFQSRAGPERWGNASYLGVRADLEYGCLSCSSVNLPVAIFGVTAIKQAKQIVRSFFVGGGGVASAFGFSGGQHGGESVGIGVGDTDHAPPAATQQSYMPRENAAVEDGRPAEMDMHELESAIYGEHGAERAPPLKSERPLDHLPTTPSPTVPSADSACTCGYRLTSMLLYPLRLLRPDQTPSAPLAFNHSAGLPTLDMTQEEALSVLTELRDLSAPFGTQMIFHTMLGGNDPDGPRMQSRVFAQVLLDPEAN